MKTLLEQKSTVMEIKARFDNDVERFSNLETGQASTIDAPLVMELVAQAAFESTAKIQKVLDVGCGAGNSTIKLSRYAAPFDCDLVDLSSSMLIFDVRYWTFLSFFIRSDRLSISRRPRSYENLWPFQEVSHRGELL